MVELLSDPNAWLSLAALAALEIVLGIDNIVFIAILTGRLEGDDRKLAYRLGLGGALFMRVGLLLAISWVMGLTAPLFALLGQEISGRDLILLVGGLFLIAKSAHEICDKVEAHRDLPVTEKAAKPRRGLWAVIVQIMAMDMIFSLDSVITAVGMSNQIPIMIAAVVIALAVMLIFAQTVGDFVNKHPSMKILALSFMLLIGVLLMAEGLGQHVSKAYIYVAMGFALIVELLNLRFHRNVQRTLTKA